MLNVLKTETVCTFDEYRRFNRTVRNKAQGGIWIKIALIAICIIAAFLVSNLETKRGLFLGAILVIPVFMLSEYMVDKRAYKKTEDQNMQKVKMFFYPDFLRMEAEGSDKGATNVSYNKFYGIIETPKNFYILFTKNQGTIVIKENCDEELIQFIHNLKNNK